MSPNKPKAEEFDGRAAEMRDSPWLAKEDIQGKGDVHVIVESVHRYHDVEFDKGRKKPTVYTLRFEKCQRELVLNATNRKTMVQLYGPVVKEWIGKKAVLFVDPDVKMKGEKVGGIRIRRNV